MDRHFKNIDNIASPVVSSSLRMIVPNLKICSLTKGTPIQFNSQLLSSMSCSQPTLCLRILRLDVNKSTIHIFHVTVTAYNPMVNVIIWTIELQLLGVFTLFHRRFYS